MKRIFSGDFETLETTSGLVISGVNSELDKLPKSYFKACIGKNLFFLNPDGTFVSDKIIDVNIAKSIIGQNNINFLLPISLKNKIHHLSRVFIQD